jgi:hypothetical protein
VKKSEMEVEFQEYRRLVEVAKAHESMLLYQAAIDAAISAWPHADGAIQYTRRHTQVVVTDIEAVTLVLRLAPLVLDGVSLRKLAGLLSESRRIAKGDTWDYARDLDRAWERLWSTYRIFLTVEPKESFSAADICVADTVGSFSEEVIEGWLRLGLVTRLRESGHDQLSFTTQMRRPVMGKCPKCGATVRGPKVSLLSTVKCPKCHNAAEFVLLPIHTPVKAGGR